MSVLLSDGRNNLKGTIHHILDTYSTGIDYPRGIFIKPNIVFPVRQESGEITPLTLVRTIISALRERHNNLDIVIGEGVAAGCDPWENFCISGYADLAEELNVPLLDLHSAERTRVEWKFGKLDLPSVVLEHTYINLPILKSSSACIISGALKNQKGLLLPEIKKQFHRHGLHEQIAELNAAAKPALTIMDSSRFLGRQVLLSGNNCGEIDATACQLLGIDEPEHVKLSRDASVFGSGYSIIGDKFNRRRLTSRPTAKEYKRLGRLRLWSNPRACTMCRYIFQDIQNNFFKHPNYSAGVKMLALSIKGAEILMGSDPKWEKEYETVICVGECTRRLAKRGRYTHIPGCPPTTSDFLNNLP